MQRFLAILLILAGLGGAGYGIATATILRESDTVVATATPSGDGTMLVTAPGVLGMVDDSVTVRASVPEGQKVTLAIGTETDVLGWVGEDPYDSVTGMTDWTSLAVVPGSGVADEPAADASAPAGEEGDAPAEKSVTGPDPAGSDLWVSEVTGETSVTLRWTDQAGPYSLLAAGVGKGAQAPTVELTWPRPVTTPYLWPGVIGGGFLVLLGVFLLIGARRGKGPKARSQGRKPARTVREPLTHQDDLPRRNETGDSPFPPARSDDDDADRVSAPAAAQAAFPSSADPDHGTAVFPPSGGDAPAPGRRWGSAPKPAPSYPAEPAAAAQSAPATGSWAATPPAPGSGPAYGNPARPQTGAEPVPAGPPAPGSLRRRRGLAGGVPAAGATPAGATPAPAAPPARPAPGARPPAAPQPPAAPEYPATGGRPATGATPSGRMMTRRERRLAEQAGRGNTAAQPVVPPPAQQPEPPQQPDQAQSGRAAAWRAAWGIKDEDGDNR